MGVEFTDIGDEIKYCSPPMPEQSYLSPVLIKIKDDAYYTSKNITYDSYMVTECSVGWMLRLGTIVTIDRLSLKYVINEGIGFFHFMPMSDIWVGV